MERRGEGSEAQEADHTALLVVRLVVLLLAPLLEVVPDAHSERVRQGEVERGRRAAHLGGREQTSGGGRCGGDRSLVRGLRVTSCSAWMIEEDAVRGAIRNPVVVQCKRGSGRGHSLWQEMRWPSVPICAEVDENEVAIMTR